MGNQVIRVENMPPNLNVYRNMHYYELNKEKKLWSQIVKAIVREQKIQPMERIHQVYEFFFRDKKEHDPDNYSTCAKFLNDGLVDAGILPRDNFDHIVTFMVKQGGISKQPYILIHMEDAG